MKQLVAVRFVKRRDLERVLEIEKAAHAAFEKEERKRAWREKDFTDFLGTAKTRGFVVEEGKGNVVGFLLVNYANADALEITRLTVHPDYRRSEFGSAFLEKVLEIQEKLKRGEAIAFVYEGDAASQQFFKAQRWPSKIARNKFGPGQDAVRFYAAK